MSSALLTPFECLWHQPFSAAIAVNILSIELPDHDVNILFADIPWDEGNARPNTLYIGFQTC